MRLRVLGKGRKVTSEICCSAVLALPQLAVSHHKWPVLSQDHQKELVFG